MINFCDVSNEIKWIWARNGRFPTINHRMYIPIWPLIIELGDFKITSATPLNELGWFMLGLILLTGSSVAALWWRRRAHPDPFI